MLIRGLAARGLESCPFLIALVGSTNAGSAATVIGDPQNILIGQFGRAPGAFGLASVYVVIWLVWRRRLAGAPEPASVLGVAGAVCRAIARGLYLN